MLTFHFLFLHVFLKDQMREISSQLPIWGAIISSPPLKYLKEKKKLFQIVLVCHHEFRCKFLVLSSLQFWLLMCEFCQMTWTSQNLIFGVKIAGPCTVLYCTVLTLYKWIGTASWTIECIRSASVQKKTSYFLPAWIVATPEVNLIVVWILSDLFEFETDKKR